MQCTTSSWSPTVGRRLTTRRARFAPGCWGSPSGWRQRRPEVSLDLPEAELPDPAEGPEDAVAQSQSRTRLQAALGQITLDQRAVVVMHDLNGVPVPEIASALDVPLNTVYSRLRLGRAKVAEALRGPQ